MCGTPWIDSNHPKNVFVVGSILNLFSQHISQQVVRNFQSANHVRNVASIWSIYCLPHLKHTFVQLLEANTGLDGGRNPKMQEMGTQKNCAERDHIETFEIWWFYIQEQMDASNLPVVASIARTVILGACWKIDQLDTSFRRKTQLWSCWFIYSIPMKAV